MHHAIVAHAKIDNLQEVLATVDGLMAKYGVTLQLLDADAVYNARHLESAIFHAERAFQEQRNSANSLAGEILMYVAGDRRVDAAILKAGVRPGLTRIIVLAIGYRGGAAIWDLLDRLGWSKDPAGLVPNPVALERNGIVGRNGGSEAALLERVALVDIQK